MASGTWVVVGVQVGGSRGLREFWVRVEGLNRVDRVLYCIPLVPLNRAKSPKGPKP